MRMDKFVRKNEIDTDWNECKMIFLLFAIYWKFNLIDYQFSFGELVADSEDDSGGGP